MAGFLALAGLTGSLLARNDGDGVIRYREAVGRVHGLVPGGHPHPGIIRPAMGNTISHFHRGRLRSIGGKSTGLPESGQSAHVKSTSTRSFLKPTAHQNGCVSEKRISVNPADCNMVLIP